MFVGVLCCSLFWYALIYVPYNFAIILTRRRELIALLIRDMFHVYLNRFKFHFLRLYVNKTTPFFIINNGSVPVMPK